MTTQSVDEQDIPPAPPTMPASPIARDIEATVERVFERVLDRIEKSNAEVKAAIETVEKKNAGRHRLVVRRLSSIERRIADHEARLRALETTRIVIQGLGGRVEKLRRRKSKKGARRAAKR